MSNSPLYVCTTFFFIHSSILDSYVASILWVLSVVLLWKLGCMHLLTSEFSSCLKSGIVPSYGNYIFRLLRNFILYSIVAVFIYGPTNSVGLFPFLQTLLIVFLTFIFLMISDVLSFFIWLLVIWLLYFCKAFCVHFRISAQTYWCAVNFNIDFINILGSLPVSKILTSFNPLVFLILLKTYPLRYSDSQTLHAKNIRDQRL